MCDKKCEKCVSDLIAPYEVKSVCYLYEVKGVR